MKLISKQRLCKASPAEHCFICTIYLLPDEDREDEEGNCRDKTCFLCLGIVAEDMLGKLKILYSLLMVVNWSTSQREGEAANESFAT